MPKNYRKKASISQAVYFDGDNTQEVIDFVDGQAFIPNTPYKVVVVPLGDVPGGAAYHVYPGKYLIKEGNVLNLMSEDEFNSIYEEIVEHENILGQEDEWHH